MNHHLWCKVVPTSGEVKAYAILHQTVCQSVVPMRRHTVTQTQWTQLLRGRSETDCRAVFLILEILQIGMYI